MPFYAKLRKSDDHVRSVHRLTLIQADKYPPAAPTYIVQINQIQFDIANNQGVFHEGSTYSKYMWNGTTFVQVADPRPTITFSPDNLELEIDAIQNVTVTHSNNLNGTFSIMLGTRPLRADFVNGVASVGIDTSKPGNFGVVSQQQFRVIVPLDVTVYSREIGLKS